MFRYPASTATSESSLLQSSLFSSSREVDQRRNKEMLTPSILRSPDRPFQNTSSTSLLGHASASVCSHSTAALRLDSCHAATCTSLAASAAAPSRPYALSFVAASPLLRRSLSHCHTYDPSHGGAHGGPRRWSLSGAATARDEEGSEAAEVFGENSSLPAASPHHRHELAEFIAAQPAGARTTGVEVSGAGPERSGQVAHVATASLSQALLRRSSQSVATVSAAAATAARPGARLTSTLRGKGGVVVAVVLAVAGIATLVMREHHSHQHDEEHEESGNECEQCGGYGLHCCTLCQGTGLIRWEGKFDRNDPCPACLGEGCSKCPECGGVRIRKGIPPIVLDRRVF